MFTSRSDTRTARLLAVVALVAAAFSLSACEIDPAEFRFGEDLRNLQLVVFDPDVGIFPGDIVRADPNNPFRRSTPSQVTAFAILDSSSAAAAFYAFATRLAIEPSGEHQFYAAESAEAVFRAGQAPEEDLPLVRDIAIRGYESLLENFPDSFSFTDDSATESFRLATPSYQGIIRLGGTPPPGWTLVVNDDGDEVAVR